MKEGTNNGCSIQKQAIVSVLIVCVIAVSAIVFVASRIPRIDPTLTDLPVLAQAIERFESEYGRLPKASALDFEMEGPEAVKLITVLLGKEQGAQSDMQNPRQIVFLTGRNTKHKEQGGIVYSSGNKAEGIYDAWGNPVRVILRPPGKTAITLSFRGKQVDFDRSAIALSRGPDQKWGTEDDLMSDNEAQ
ncbi:hypothetical protein [Luteolibacter soli]|uniref:Type II secretion system protein GspH n=1 Tax=Luteolibacter soli TaxID=3135280 RepID=A0ABU9AZX4_9BACT